MCHGKMECQVLLLWLLCPSSPVGLALYLTFHSQPTTRRNWYLIHHASEQLTWHLSHHALHVSLETWNTKFYFSGSSALLLLWVLLCTYHFIQNPQQGESLISDGSCITYIMCNLCWTISYVMRRMCHGKMEYQVLLLWLLCLSTLVASHLWGSWAALPFGAIPCPAFQGTRHLPSHNSCAALPSTFWL